MCGFEHITNVMRNLVPLRAARAWHRRVVDCPQDYEKRRVGELQAASTGPWGDTLAGGEVLDLLKAWTAGQRRAARFVFARTLFGDTLHHPINQLIEPAKNVRVAQGGQRRWG